ncbi:MAG: DNA mismatch repair endonuclease MutL [Dehalococcoidales bacterium]|nr:DNA mismatch repair endonuclease MutL [Dehalococcoidales bacterium]
MTIKVLDSRVISQIAAGEVIERPASVVKELVENSLDAGSSQISVEIRNGGTGLIRVVDNGQGIADDQTETAFERHATSKISGLDDLQVLSTLGFRGEALPSIAAVAEVQMQTCARGETSGTFMSLEDGRVVRHEKQARSSGTTITVSNLFRKIPARLKFLKSVNVESGRIADIVSHYALAYPEVKFTFTVDGRTALRTPGNGRLMESIEAVYGLEAAGNMLDLCTADEKWEDGASPVEVSGMAGSPRISRSTRDHISLFVNRRWVNNRTIAYAVEEAYHGMLMQGRHPVAVINLSLPSRVIDVNVHPSKTEIKFQDERTVFAAVQRAVRRVLVRSTPVPQIEDNRSGFGIPQTPVSAPGPGSPVTESAASEAAFRIKPPEPANRNAPGQASFTPLISLPLLRVLGQLARSYIVAEGPDGLFLIDQHAAHERIMLEKINEQRESRQIEMQGLLQPVTFEIEPGLSATLVSHLDELAGFGFILEPFGERTFLVRAVPAVLGDRDWATALREALETRKDDWKEQMAITLACHSAIRAGQVLSEAEMRELIKQLEQVKMPHCCPHGRPTMIHMTVPRIEKEFGRT